VKLTGVFSEGTERKASEATAKGVDPSADERKAGLEGSGKV
jgi:hypothetical protein